MDHAETVAQCLLEAVLVGTRMVYRSDQSRGQYDFDLHHSDGRVSAVEVTSSTDEDGERTNAAIRNKKKGGSAIKTTLCKKDWYIDPTPTANINRIRARADEYLAAIESAGIEEFFSQIDWDQHSSIERIYRELGVERGSVFPWKEPGYIRIAPPGGGGVVNASTAVAAIECEAKKDDNRKKLGAANQGEERHLVVYISVTNYLPWRALIDCEPSSQLPQLPSEITDVWGFSETRSEEHEYAVWRASTLLEWRNLGRIVLKT